MTVDEFCAYIREAFSGRDLRVCAFKVRVVTENGTMTIKRSEMTGQRANKIQRDACKASILAARTASQPEKKE